MFFSSTIKHWFTEAPHFEGTVVASEQIGTRIQKVTIKLPSPVAKPFPVGCYVQTMTWGVVPRAYSVATADKASFTLLVSFSGKGAGARFFAKAVLGTKVTCYGPFDDFPYRYGTGRSKVFFATSTGVAPFRRMAEEAIKENLKAVLILGSPKASDLAFRSDFETLAKNSPLFTFLPTLSSPSPEWTGAHGYVTDQAGDDHKASFLRRSDVYICGIPPMAESVLTLLEKIGVPKEQIFVQKFG